MTPDDVLNYYHTPSRFCELTGITRNAFYTWRKKGCIPIASQKKLVNLTNGYLKLTVPIKEQGWEATLILSDGKETIVFKSDKKTTKIEAVKDIKKRFKNGLQKSSD